MVMFKLFKQCNIRLIVMVSLLFILFSAGVVYAGALSGNEVKELVSGNTVEAVHATIGYSIITYHLADGTYRQLRDSETCSGKWSVDNEGQLCMMRTGWGGECRLIVKDGNVWKAYKIPKNPMKPRKHERTFNQVVKGNPHNL